MNILSINNFNLKTPLFLNDKKQNNSNFWGLKLASPLKEDTVSFQGGCIERSYKKAGDLKDGLTNVRAIKFRLMHVPAHEKNLHLFSNKGARYLSTPNKRGLATLINRIKGEFEMSQKAASLQIGILSDEEILKRIRDISGFSYIIEDSKGYQAVIKDLCEMVKHGEINPILVKYQKLPEEYKKGKLVNSHDSLNPAISAKLREMIKNVKGLKTDLWNTTPSESGYSGLHIIIKNADGTFSEIQIKVRSVADLKDVEDLYYKMTNGKNLSPKYVPLEMLLRDIKPIDPKKLTEEEKIMHKALNKYSIEAYNFALEHPYEEDAPFLSVASAKTLNAREKELIAQFDFNRIKLFQQNPDAIEPLAHV